MERMNTPSPMNYSTPSNMSIINGGEQGLARSKLLYLLVLLWLKGMEVSCKKMRCLLECLKHTQ